jgi:hypothetical protein
MSGLLVAAMTMARSLGSKPSISTSSLLALIVAAADAGAALASGRVDLVGCLRSWVTSRSSSTASSTPATSSKTVAGTSTAGWHAGARPFARSRRWTSSVPYVGAYPTV